MSVMFRLGLAVSICTVLYLPVCISHTCYNPAKFELVIMSSAGIAHLICITTNPPMEKTLTNIWLQVSCEVYKLE